MQKHYNYLDIDLDNKNYRRLKAMQGDSKSRYILVNLISNNLYYDLSGVTVKIYGMKKDKTIFFNNATIVDATKGQFEIELTNQALAVAGDLKIQILILGPNEEKLTTFSFFIEVAESIIDEVAIESSNEFKALTTSLSKVEEWNGYFEETSGKIEEKYTERLNKFDEQFNTKANKDEVFTMANMGQDIKEAMTGGSVAVVGKGAVLPVNMSTKLMDYLYDKSMLNLYNPNTSLDKKAINGLGVITDNEYTILTDFIDIEEYFLENTAIFFKQSKDSISVNNANVGYACIYNSDKQVISTSEKQFYDAGVITKESLPEGYKYIRCSFSKDYVNFGIGKLEAPLHRHYVEKKEKINDEIAKLKGKKWVAIGDSITYGYYYDGQTSGKCEWVKDVADYFEMKFVNLGTSGSTTAGFLRYEIINNIPSDVDIITIMGGTNDYSQNVNPNDVSGYEFNTGTYPGSLRLLIKTLNEKFPNARIMLCNCMSGGHSNSINNGLYEKNTQNKTYEDYANICGKIAHELSLPFIDLFGNSGVNLLNRDTFLCDEVHPNLAGYERIKKVYKQAFINNIMYLTQ